MNLYEATLSPELAAPKLGSQTLALPAERRRAAPGTARLRRQEVVVGIRPEHLALANGATAAGNTLAVDTALVEALGSEQLLHFTIDAERLHAPDDR